MLLQARRDQRRQERETREADAVQVERVRLFKLPRFLMAKCGQCHAPRGEHHKGCPMMPRGAE